MDKFATNIYNLCTEIQPYTYILVIVALIIIGVMLLVPSDESRQKAKKGNSLGHHWSDPDYWGCVPGKVADRKNRILVIF